MQTLSVSSSKGKNYQVVFKKTSVEPLPKEVLKTLEFLYENLPIDPLKHIDSLIKLHTEHPNSPLISNFLTYAYLKLKKKKEAEILIEQTYHAHPDHLIARINYADQALRLKKLEQIPLIFNHCFDLHTLYPQKESYHYAEFRGFHVVMGFYHLAIGDQKAAEECYELAFQVDPLHPSVSALEKKLFKGWGFKKIFKKLQNLACISKNT